MDHEHRDPRVVVDVGAHAAEQVGGHASASARAHRKQIVAAGLDLLDDPFAGLAQPAIVNGAAGVIVAAGDRVIGVCGITVSNGRIAAIDLVRDPARLREMAVSR